MNKDDVWEDRRVSHVKSIEDISDKAKEIVSMLSGWDFRSSSKALEFAAHYLQDNAIIPS